MKIIKPVDVNNVEDYFTLPKTEREFIGFYKLPQSLPCDWLQEDQKGWNFFYSEIKKHYPIQWIFRCWFFSFQNPIYYFYKIIAWKITEFKFKIQNVLNISNTEEF